MIEVEVLTKDPLYVLHDVNSISMGKRAFKKRKETKEEARDYFIKNILAEHSTIENINFRVIDDKCRADIASHIVRQTKGRPRFVIQSNRPDWNKGQKRKPLDETIVIFSSTWNLYSWIQMCRQRLCHRASLVDQQWVKKIIDIMKKSNDPLLEAIAYCSAPNCIYRGACSEIKSCGMSKSISYLYEVYNKLEG